jgi:hypothetical protein
MFIQKQIETAKWKGSVRGHFSLTVWTLLMLYFFRTATNAQVVQGLQIYVSAALLITMAVAILREVFNPVDHEHYINVGVWFFVTCFESIPSLLPFLALILLHTFAR